MVIGANDLRWGYSCQLRNPYLCPTHSVLASGLTPPALPPPAMALLSSDSPQSPSRQGDLLQALRATSGHGDMECGGGGAYEV